MSRVESIVFCSSVNSKLPPDKITFVCCRSAVAQLVERPSEAPVWCNFTVGSDHAAEKGGLEKIVLKKILSVGERKKSLRYGTIKKYTGVLLDIYVIATSFSSLQEWLQLALRR